MLQNRKKIKRHNKLSEKTEINILANKGAFIIKKEKKDRLTLFPQEFLENKWDPVKHWPKRSKML